MTIEELCARAESWADQYYRRDGKATGEARNIRAALKPLRELAGYCETTALTADLVYDCRQMMLDHGLSRKTINSHLRRLKTIMRWGARPPRRFLEPTQVADINLVEPLKKWRSDAPESPGVQPVSWETVERTAKASPVWLSVALRVHWFTGMRPGEVVGMAKSLISERDDVLIYSPIMHKTAHLDKQRHVVIGPRGQAVLRPWIAVVMGDQLFDSINQQQAYRRAVDRVCRAAGIPHWSVNQIRHSYLTRVANEDLEGAQAVAGHAKPDTTMIYVERDLRKAIATQQRFG